MIQTFAFLVLNLLTAVAFISVLLMFLHRMLLKKTNRSKHGRSPHLKRAASFLIALMIFNLLSVMISQLTAYTPPIIDENGVIPENSIAEMLQLELNGRNEWVSIRGWDEDKPVLLFLAGGPGGSQMAAVRHELSELEKHFIVVNWDQPGSGKSYYAENKRDITVETYIQDGYALTEYLKERFSEEKIYLVGESWGSALGVFLIDRFPNSYHALIGTGQMVDFEETERIDYAKALEIAEQGNDQATVEKLKKNGMPPYYGSDVAWKSAVYLNYLSAYMSDNPAIQNPGYDTLRDIASSEYTLLDKINYIRGVINTYNYVYQQLYEIDLRTDYIELDVPVYFFIGRFDLNAPTSLVEEYFQLLDAPDKKFIWFEHSGHSPWINEKDKFTEEVIACFSEDEL